MRHLKWLLTTLAINTDLNNPQTVAKWIEQRTPSGNYRNTFLCAYKQLRKFLGLKTDLDKYERNQREIRCPTKENLQMIIANSGKLMSLKLQISMNTGLRPVELFTLRTKDIDTEQKTIYPKTAKHGAPRKIGISNTLNERIRNYIIKNDKQPNDQLFKGDEVRYGKEYREIRNKLAKKLNNPTIQSIRLYDFRHYFGTMTYHKTRNIKLTQYLMGHKHSNTTDIYTHLLNINDDEWICNTAQTIAEAKQLIEAGFQYATTMEGIQLFKKRK